MMRLLRIAVSKILLLIRNSSVDILDKLLFMCNIFLFFNVKYVIESANSEIFFYCYDFALKVMRLLRIAVSKILLFMRNSSVDVLDKLLSICIIFLFFNVKYVIESANSEIFFYYYDLALKVMRLLRIATSKILLFIRYSSVDVRDMLLFICIFFFTFFKIC